MEMDQLRDCEQTWDSLQRYINIFSSKYGYTNIEYTLQEKKPYLYSPIGVWLKIALAILLYLFSFLFIFIFLDLELEVSIISQL